MKILIILSSLLLSFQSFAADPTNSNPAAPMVGSDSAMNSATGAKDKTLLTKPAGEACKADREKFCADVKPGNGAIIKCMKAHESELSPACKAFGDAMKQKFQEKAKDIKEACAVEISTTCKAAKGPHEKMECLKAHSTDLSPGCQAALPPFKK
jgi:hypothetical protein